MMRGVWLLGLFNLVCVLFLSIGQGLGYFIVVTSLQVLVFYGEMEALQRRAAALPEEVDLPGKGTYPDVTADPGPGRLVSWMKLAGRLLAYVCAFLGVRMALQVFSSEGAYAHALGQAVVMGCCAWDRC